MESRGAKLSNRFCMRPFVAADVGEDGSIRFCPAGWQNNRLGHIEEGSLRDAWNSFTAKAVRRSILKGEFAYCSRQLCPYLSPGFPGLPMRDDVSDPFFRKIIDENIVELSTSPREVALNCRSVSVAATAAISDGLLDAQQVTLSRQCEPLGDPFYLSLLRDFDWAAHLSLRLTLVTNGQLFTRALWNDIRNCHVTRPSVNVVVNASTSATYKRAFPGASFRQLLQNLRFIAALRRRQILRWLTIEFNIDRNNFREMPNFVRMGQALGVDRVIFRYSPIRPGVSDMEMVRNALAEVNHECHEEFMEILRDPLMRAPIVDAKELSAFMPAAPVLSGPHGSLTPAAPIRRKLARFRASMRGDARLYWQLAASILTRRGTRHV